MTSETEAEAAWVAREEEYRAEIAALEEEQITLRDAWSEIVRTNMATAEDLKLQLIESTNERDAAQAELDELQTEHAESHDALAVELADAKLKVAQLCEERDRLHQQLVLLLRKFPAT
ncbi:hypothetical protein CTAYLR_006238 [Chrysophaeum taylorii]|uniref:Uncharacterized protein n=1 Tax=Chrysophaeum taylorii TaxID=2483200 RepID=A0AAD7UJ59_9STRA|nr:hypothetical protein CTAYLR_006238 [Chrysophaeum taylorii]